MQNDAPNSAPAAPKGLAKAGIVAAGVAAVVVGAGIFTRMNDASAAQHWAEARAVPTVHLVPATRASVAGDLALPGTLAAWNAAKLYARVGGYVRAWYRDIGAEVGAGQPLGQIDTPELDQQIVQARADLASARAHAELAHSTAARWSDLLSSNSVSRQEADEKNGDWAVRRAAVQGAQANLDRLMALKAFATVRAPFPGVVTQRAADIGDLVGPGTTNQQPMFAVADTHRLRIYVGVPQAYSSVIHPGLGATLTVPGYAGRSFPAQVVGISGAVDPQNGSFQVQLAADNPGGALKPGDYAQVRFDMPGQAGAIQIPASALIFRAQGSQVALVGSDGRVHLRTVKIGRDMGQAVEIASGLSAGQRVVDNPPDSIGDGEAVHVASGSHG